jgi:hypothetical protein
MTNSSSNSNEAPKTAEQSKPSHGPQQNQGGGQKPAEQPQQK